MAPHRNEFEALARMIDVLLDTLEPQEMAARFLRHASEVFQADAGLFQLRRGETTPILAAIAIPPAEAQRLADELAAARGRARKTYPLRRARKPGAGEAEWASGLVVRIQRGAPGHDGLVALLGRAPDCFRPRRDFRLLHLMALQAIAAVDSAASRTQTRRLAEQYAIQAEALERIHRALEEHSREIERSLAHRSRFFAALSHELRTPINAILGYGQLLSQGFFGALTPRQADILDKIGASARQLQALVDDVLDFSRIDAGWLELQRDRVELPAIVAEAAATIELYARLKGLELHIDCDPALPTLETDPTRVRQILLNLLSNAVKYTPRGSITIEARHLPTRADLTAAPLPSSAPGPNGWVRIAVHDTGVGIPAEQIDAIFREFVRLPHPDIGRTEGTGLGLAISSRLARLLGGDLTVDSEVGVRSTFALYLPCPAPALES